MRKVTEKQVRKRERTASKNLTKRLGPLGRLDTQIDKTINDIERTGSLPSLPTMEQRFPGISTSFAAKDEVYMTLIFRLQLRGYYIHQIAQQLGTTEAVIYRVKKRMAARFEEEVGNMSFTGQVGRSLATFQELQAEASKIVYNKKEGTKDKLRAIHVMSNIEHSKLSVLRLAGFFNASKLTPKRLTAGGNSDVENLQQQILLALQGRDDMDFETEQSMREDDIYDAEYTTEFEDTKASVFRG